MMRLLITLLTRSKPKSDLWSMMLASSLQRTMWVQFGAGSVLCWPVVSKSAKRTMWVQFSAGSVLCWPVVSKSAEVCRRHFSRLYGLLACDDETLWGCKAEEGKALS
ncbi:hypothetical protein Ddc_16343 [Ditylenchus destructor]|nr:hypothetical protein Ddc_16343 [Ditylenchus destructor]